MNLLSHSHIHTHTSVQSAYHSTRHMCHDCTHTFTHCTTNAHLSPTSRLSNNDVDNGHDNEEEVKLIPATAPVVAPAQPGYFDGSFNDEDGCEGIVAVLLGLGKCWRLTIGSGSQDDDVSDDGCCDDVVEGLQADCCESGHGGCVACRQANRQASED